MMPPFSAQPAATVNIDVSGTAQSVQITKNPGIRQIRVMNNGTATVWIKFGKATGDAATVAADVPVGPGVTEVLTAKIDGGPVWVSAIAAGATGKIYFTPGVGL
jgi:hypothetical protein